MLRRPPLSTLTDPLFPSTPLFRSAVDYAVTGEVDGADFVGGLLPGGTLTFAAGEASKTLSFNVAGDGDEEPDEDFTVTLSNASAGSAILTASAGGTLQNADGPPAPPVERPAARPDRHKSGREGEIRREEG